MPLELYPFRFRDPVTGKWVRARYRATRQEIAQRHAAYEITGPAEVRNVDAVARSFSPHRQAVSNLGPILAIVESRWQIPWRVAIADVAT